MLRKPDRVSPADVARLSRRQTLRGFAGLGLAAAAGYASWRWLLSRPEEGGVPWPLRRVLRFDERVSRALFRQGSRIAERPPGSAPVGGTRLNTSLGTDPTVTNADYRLTLTGLAAGTATLTLADLKALPRTAQTTMLCCVEGWNTWANWAGVRLADLAAHYPPAAGLPYVAMSTADHAYYVGLDAASALHPQTLLAYELDGQPLSVDHGSPVRLVIPTKYGIKNIKQVVRIAFTAERPPDYWAEQGYDWYAGL